MARSKRLHVLVDGEHAGTLDRDQSRMTLTYEDDYRHSPNATPLSTSLPLGLQVHSGVPVAAYVDGLLPDSEMVRRRWAAEFHTRDTPFDLIAHVGEDCAGAVQFIREERLNQLDPGGIEWLSDQEIGAWIRQLRIDPAGWLQDVEFGQFSLAGVQSKFALLHDDGRWGRPYGAIPTTHIVKPASSNFAHHEINEHLALALARAIGLTAARSEIVEFDGERVVVVERFDRLRLDGVVRRVHQEDMCQAAAVRPERKYENNGGPSAPIVVSSIRDRSSSVDEDIAAFIDAFVFNWLIANTDAHAKNYGLLLAGSQCRLAPLYDLASALPYVAKVPTLRGPNELDGGRLGLAMSVAGIYRLSEIRKRDWESLFTQFGLDPSAQLSRALSLADAVAASMDDVVAPVINALGGPMPERFATSILNRLGLCRAVLTGRPASGYRP